MAYQKHRHFYRIERSINHGYLFKCNRCVRECLYPFHFVRANKYWG